MIRGYVALVTGGCTSLHDKAKIYNKSRELVAEANRINDLYVMKSNIYKDFENDVYVNSVKLTEKEKWHKALGRVNFQYLNKLVKDKLVDGIPDKLENNVMKCANCIQSKMANVRFENERSKNSEILELIHTDLNGPHRTTGSDREKFFLSFIDDYSKCNDFIVLKTNQRLQVVLKNM